MDAFREQPRSVLPQIDLALVQQQITCAARTEAAQAAKQQHAAGRRPELRFLAPTAAAGQLSQPPQQQRSSSPSPPPFRAGFSFERAHTPELAAQRKQQQRLAQHKLFTKALQSSSSTQQQQQHACAGIECDAAAASTAPSTDCEAATDAGGSSCANGSSCSGGGRQQQCVDGAAGTPPSSGSGGSGGSSSNSGAPVGLRKHTRSSGSGFGSSEPPPSRHPIVGSHGLLQAAAAGCSQQALNSLVAESLAMACSGLQPDHSTAQYGTAGRNAGRAANGALTLQLPSADSFAAANSSSSSSARRRTGEAAAAGGRNARRTADSRPGSRSSSRLGVQMRRTQQQQQHSAQQQRESDDCNEGFPTLDSPVQRPGFNLGDTAAALGHSIQQLRQLEMHQLQQQQQQQQHQQQQQGKQQAPQKQQQKRRKEGHPAGSAVAAAAAVAAGAAAPKPANSGRSGSAPSKTASGSSSSQPAQPPATKQQKQGRVSGAPAATAAAVSVAVAPVAKRRSTAAAAAAAATSAAAAAHAEQAPHPTDVKLKVRALEASPNMLGSCTKSQLLLTQAFSTTPQQLQGGQAAANTAAAVTAPLQPPPPSFDPVMVLFGGRRSPARDRVLRASWDKQRLWQQQQEQLQPGWRQQCSQQDYQQQQQQRLSLMPEPYLDSHRRAEDRCQLATGVSGPNNSSSSSGRFRPQLPSLRRTASAAVGLSGACQKGAAGLSSGSTSSSCGPQPQDATTGMLLQQLASNVTRSVNLQATAAASLPTGSAAAAAAEAAEAAEACTAPQWGSATAKSKAGGSAGLGLVLGEVERLIARYHQQGQAGVSSTELLPATFNLDHALACRQQVQALASALPQLPDLRMLLLRNNGLIDRDLQTLSAALLNPACSGVCSLDLGFNKLSREAPLLLLPLLHQPPAQMLQQARRRSTAEAAGEGEVLAAGRSSSQNPSCAGACQSSLACADKSSLSAQHRRRNSNSNGGGAGSINSSNSGQPQPQQPLLRGMDHAMLLQLVMCSNPIGDAGAEVICKVVGTGDCLLQLLDLSGCCITERLSGCLRGMLEGARQLRVLRLGWNVLGPKGGRALAEGLKYCSSGLEQLYLPWSGITDTGASHITKALESNASVKLLDLSGCQVSAGTCVVLAETLSSNTTLDAVILQDNPLGALGVQKLLRAVHEGHVRHVDIAGCSFLSAPTRQLAGTNSSSSAVPDAAKPGKGSKKGTKAKAAGCKSATAAAAAGKPASAAARKAGTAASAGRGKGAAAAGSGSGGSAEEQLRQIGGQAGSAAAAFSVREPDGCYTLDLALPSDRQVAVELLKLTEAHGLDSWVSPTLNKKAFSITGVTKQSLPSSGQLCVTFAAKHKLSWEAQALCDPEFHALWTQHVQPRATPSRPSLLLQQPQETLNPGTQWTDPGFSWPAGGGLRLNEGSAGLEGSSFGGNGMRVHAVSDGWKLELLQVLLQECYFTSAQAGQMVAAFNYGEDKVEAAVKVFGRTVDPENFADQAYITLNAWQVELADQRIGCLRFFSPDNCTGKYSLLLSHPAQRLVGVRLVELFCQQHIDGLCSHPHSVCFTSSSLDDKPLPPDAIRDPLRIRLPKSGIFKVCFVDLRPAPAAAKPVSAAGFAVLLSMLTGADKLDGWELAHAVDAADLETKVSVVGRFETWSSAHGPFSGKVGVLARRLHAPAGPAQAAEAGAAAVQQVVAVKDVAGFLEAIHIFAIHHHLTGAQLLELLKLVPPAASEQRVELCSRFWARLTDRPKTWSDVMRALTPEQQVTLAHRLGVANVFDAVRPSMHYRLRMWRADEHQIAWRLHRMALNAAHDAFVALTIDGQLKKVAQTANLWSLMRGSAADNETPTVTLEFDFVFQDNLRPHWAAVTIQSAWRAYQTRKAAPPQLRQRLESLCGRQQQQHALGVRASIGGAKQSLMQLPPQQQDGSSVAPTHRSSVVASGHTVQGAYSSRSALLSQRGSVICPAEQLPLAAASSEAGAGGLKGSGFGGATMGRRGLGQQQQPEWDTLLLKTVRSSAAGGLQA